MQPAQSVEQSAESIKKLSIIILCFNEKSTIEMIYDRVLQVPLPYEKEIIIVDDCSTDGTRDVLAAMNGPENKAGNKVGSEAVDGAQSEAKNEAGAQIGGAPIENHIS
ncbi:hypothetical protein BKN38_01735 [Helicobacter sp. CLO-3]|uniref:glycosyltransferase family 2 protein n=1 Tax=unclassified Helicobacter TaxID=2593540 RepID=UPI000805EF7A|nr:MULTISPECIES: glycosyltransferase [unclassified Helicobacter]OBV29597.1 hypothetical protein BA723_04770 [Helicobacter sp. CLO-3]OHU85274.1 hypothetical protein BKN38_01735 [Helicobacter sp. CLO-3]